MQHEVFPLPTAPKTAMPVNSPRSGITSQLGVRMDPDVARCAFLPGRQRDPFAFAVPGTAKMSGDDALANSQGADVELRKAVRDRRCKVW